MPPWAKFMIFRTPRMRVSPAAMRKYIMAVVSPLRNWNINTLPVINDPLFKVRRGEGQFLPHP